MKAEAAALVVWGSGNNDLKQVETVICIQIASKLPDSCCQDSFLNELNLMRRKWLNLTNFKHRLSPRMSFKESAFGWDGLHTFIFSNVLLLLSLGLGFFWLLGQTLKTALLTKCSNNTVKTVLIAGLRLHNNQLTDEFRQRLERARLLADSAPENKLQIIILGGYTANNQLSEARAGADYLIDRGIDAGQIILEEQSRHTLENLQHARLLLAESARQTAAIISSRYHLYRLLTLAKGLHMQLLPIAAEDHFRLSLANLLRILKEVYYLHWYWSGKLWVFITLSKKNRSGIT